MATRARPEHYAMGSKRGQSPGNRNRDPGRHDQHHPNPDRWRKGWSDRQLRGNGHRSLDSGYRAGRLDNGTPGRSDGFGYGGRGASFYHSCSGRATDYARCGYYHGHATVWGARHCPGGHDGYAQHLPGRYRSLRYDRGYGTLLIRADNRWLDAHRYHDRLHLHPLGQYGRRPG